MTGKTTAIMSGPAQDIRCEADEYDRRASANSTALVAQCAKTALMAARHADIGHRVGKVAEARLQEWRRRGCRSSGP